MSRITVFVILAAIPGFVQAGSSLSFPDASEIIGADLPKILSPLINREFELEVMQRFEVERTYMTDLKIAFKWALLRKREAVCGNKLGDEQQFLSEVLFKGKYDPEVSDLLAQSDAILKLRLYLSYMPKTTPAQYAELKVIPVNDLSRDFVATWVYGAFVRGSMARLETAAADFLRVRCETSQETPPK